MRLRKSKDNRLYEAKLGDRRVRTYKNAAGVQIRIKRIEPSEYTRRVKEIRTKGGKTITIDAICVHITDKKTAELNFDLSFKGAEALLACLTNLYNDNRADFPE